MKGIKVNLVFSEPDICVLNVRKRGTAWIIPVGIAVNATSIYISIYKDESCVIEMSKNLFGPKEFENSHKKNTGSIKEALVEILVFILTLAIMVPIAINTAQYAFGVSASPYRVAGHSMDPTLADGQLVIANKTEDGPANGDVVVTLMHEKGLQFCNDKKARYIVKRVAAGPGETIDIGPDNVILINGVAIDEPYLTETAKNATYVPNYQTHYELADDEYFVVGDNRANSCDSRYFGAVKYEEISGVVNMESANPKSLIVSVVKYGLGIMVLYLLVEKVLLFALSKIFKV